MFSFAQLRRLGPLLLGLFVFAQAAGIMPLISLHIQHAFESEQDIAADLSESSKINHVHHHHAHRAGGQHEHGANDPNDQCCTLHHHLAGVMPITSGISQHDLRMSVVRVPPRSFVGTDPGTPERPPKLPLSI
jgi:hypothetical protein